MTEKTTPRDLSARINSLPAEKRALLERELNRKVSQHTGVTRRARAEGPCPLSFAQQRLWFLDQFEPGSSAYNVATALRLPGPLDASALARSLDEVVRRHEVLRTTFAVFDGEPAQVVAPPSGVKLETFDLAGLPPAAREAEAQRLAFEHSQRGFDLTRGPLLRAALLRLDAADHVLLLTMHHIVSDGWSLGLLLSELTTLYQAYSSGAESPLAELPIQYADFAVWQRERLQGDSLAALLGYWKRQLAGAPPVLDLPTDRPRGALVSHSGATQLFRLSPDLSEALRALALREGATLFMLLLAAFKTLLYKYAGQTDVVVGAPIANRNRAEIENLIGFFVNTLVLRTDLSGDPTFRELVARVREVTLGAYAHQDLPFERLVEELQPERSLSHHPLFQVAFVLQNIPTLPPAAFEQSPDQPQLMTGTAKFDLSLGLFDTGREIGGAFEYGTALFDADTVGRMIGHYRTLLESIAADPGARLSELSVLTEAERRRLLSDWNDTDTQELSATPVHRLFEEQAARTPDAVALVFGGERISYRELNRRANGCARRLREVGVRAEERVALCFERGPAMLVGLLGVLKAGGAFVPLDPELPRERLGFMLRDAGARVLATERGVAEELRAEAEHVVELDGADAGEDENPRAVGAADNLAYVIYTSGSTGRPKGVLVTHRGVCNVWRSQVRLLGARPGERVLQFASPGFDAAVFEIVMALATGATLCLAPRESLLPGPPLVSLLREQEITTVTLPPSALAVMPEEDVPALGKMIVAGEPCPPELAERWARGRRFFNAYGPTETTIWATLFEYTDPRAPLPIGRPIGNTRAYLLDSSLRPVPLGAVGELYVGGLGLARGYLGRPALTAERFIPDHLSGRAGARLYRTGDLARYTADGNLVFLGRADHQVKVRGYRVELGEVEATLREHPAVAGAAVVARGSGGGGGGAGPAGGARLAAFVALRAGGSAAAGELRRFLKARLPEYMLPASFSVLDRLPLTPAGKVDRRALPAQDDAAGRAASAEFAEPRGAVEQVLAGVWAEILGLERVGRDDNFFELGGHSLLATQVASRVRDLLFGELAVRQIFETPTVAELSAALLADAARRARIERAADLVLRLSQLTDDEAAALLAETRAAGGA